MNNYSSNINKWKKIYLLFHKIKITLHHGEVFLVITKQKKKKSHVHLQDYLIE